MSDIELRMVLSRLLGSVDSMDRAVDRSRSEVERVRDYCSREHNTRLEITAERDAANERADNMSEKIALALEALPKDENSPHYEYAATIARKIGWREG